MSSIHCLFETCECLCANTLTHSTHTTLRISLSLEQQQQHRRLQQQHHNKEPNNAYSITISSSSNNYNYFVCARERVYRSVCVCVLVLHGCPWLTVCVCVLCLYAGTWCRRTPAKPLKQSTSASEHFQLHRPQCVDQLVASYQPATSLSEDGQQPTSPQST